MDLQIYHKNSSFQRDLPDRQFDGKDRSFVTLRKDETIADIFTSKASGSCRTMKNLDHLRGQLESNSKATRPNYTSLADIYEGALRKVLNLQLNLKIEDQPRFHDRNDVTHQGKSSPPRPTAIRIEDDKHRDEYRHRRHKSDEENDSRIAPQGHNILRKLGERSTAEGSAFHVPSKRRYDAVGYERESEFTVEHFGMTRHGGSEYPVEYGHSHYHPHIYGPRRDPLRRARLAPSYVGPRSMLHESYSRFSRHQRDIPPLFPVRCSSIERDGQPTPRSTETVGRDYKYPDAPCLNGGRMSKYSNSKMGKEENDKLEETFNKAIDNLTHQIQPSSPRHSPERKSPHSERYQPYGRRIRPSPPANTEVQTNGENNYKSLENVVKQENNKVNVEDGEKEEFLSNLGLARI